METDTKAVVDGAAAQSAEACQPEGEKEHE